MASRVLIAIVALCLLAAVPADAQWLPPGEEQEAPDTEPSLEPPVAHFDWSVAERYEQGWDVWGQRDAQPAVEGLEELGLVAEQPGSRW